jgi:GntR family transcriptional regulator, transcriptional repressor for pyruvate dehydrogenase complex
MRGGGNRAWRKCMKSKTEAPTQRHLTMRVVDHIRGLIEGGTLKPGDKIPPEREFAKELQISRASLRGGIGYMAAMGILNVRHGVGAFVAEGPPELGNASLLLMHALHGFQAWQMFEARIALEGQLAALAAERGSAEQFSAMGEEITDLYATIDDPHAFLIHDVRFHRVIAQASGNPVLAALMESITGVLYDDRLSNVELASNRRSAADMHREIFRAVCSRDPLRARERMECHLKQAEEAQREEKPGTAVRSGTRKRLPPKAVPRRRTRAAKPEK